MSAAESCASGRREGTEMGVERLPKTIEILDGGRTVRIVDQTLLPQEVRMVDVRTWEHMVECIKRLAVRGAPALGITGAAALATFATHEADELEKRSESGVCCDVAGFLDRIDAVAAQISAARPTAVNLSWGVKRACDAAHRVAAGFDGASASRSADAAGCAAAIADAIAAEAQAIRDEDEASCRAIGEFGAPLFNQGSRVLTHCNAGSLATAFFGTALGVIYAAHEQGRIERVYADETRPVGQGARLTAWELGRAGVPVTLICDNMAASLMAAGEVDAVVVGADRICANGDTANKIGTYGVAVAAAHHGIPFYVAAPFSTVDASLAEGSLIPIEHRAASEVTAFVPEGAEVFNPAFDVTPAGLISAIITDRGVFRPPFSFGA